MRAAVIPESGLDVTQGAAGAAVLLAGKPDVVTGRRLSGPLLGLIELRSEVSGLSQILAIS